MRRPVEILPVEDNHRHIVGRLEEGILLVAEEDIDRVGP